MTEKILIRTLDGPSPGVRLSDGFFTWPLPDVLRYPPELRLPDGYGIGYYQKVSESQNEKVSMRVLRGAQYEWRTGEPPE